MPNNFVYNILTSDKLSISLLVIMAIGAILMIVDSANLNYDKTKVLDSDMFIAGNNLTGLGLVIFIIVILCKLMDSKPIIKFYIFIAFILSIVIPYSIYATIANSPDPIPDVDPIPKSS